jgi:hypothetical protein
MADAYETKNGIRWRARWYDETGERRAKAGFRTQRAAEHFESDRDSDRRNMRVADAVVRRSSLTVAGFFEWWAEHEGPEQVAPATYNSYTWAFNAHARPRIGNVPLTDLIAKPAILQRWRHDVRTARDRRTGKPLKPATVAGAEKALSAILSSAMDEGHLPYNPMHAPSRRRRRRGRTAKLAEVVQAAEPISVVAWCLLALVLERRSRRRDRLDARRDAAMVRVGFMAGLRMPSEVVGLRWMDVGEAGLAVSGRVSEGEWEATTKTYELRNVPLWAPLRDELVALRRVVGEMGAVARDELIWHLRDEDGRLVPWSPSTMNNWRGRIWRPAARLVAETWPEYEAMARAVPYDGRHAWVSICAAANLPLIMIAKHAGHSVTMTEKIYGKLILEQMGKEPASPEQQLADAMAQAEVLYAGAFPADESPRLPA